MAGIEKKTAEATIAGIENKIVVATIAGIENKIVVATLAGILKKIPVATSTVMIGPLFTGQAVRRGTIREKLIQGFYCSSLTIQSHVKLRSREFKNGG